MNNRLFLKIVSNRRYNQSILSLVDLYEIKSKFRLGFNFFAFLFLPFFLLTKTQFAITPASLQSDGNNEVTEGNWHNKFSEPIAILSDSENSQQDISKNIYSSIILKNVKATASSDTSYVKENSTAICATDSYDCPEFSGITSTCNDGTVQAEPELYRKGIDDNEDSRIDEIPPGGIQTDFTFAVRIPEICNNGIDDDGDGLVDEGYPGGVSDHLQLWLKADVGTNNPSSGATVNAWADQSDNGYSADADVNATDLPIYNTAAINFNPGVSFAGTYSDDFSDGLHLGSDYIYSNNSGMHFFGAIRPTSLGSQYDAIVDFGGTSFDGYGYTYSETASRMKTPAGFGGEQNYYGHANGYVPAITEFEIDFGVGHQFYIDGSLLSTRSYTGLSQLTAAEIGESDHYGTAANGDDAIGPFSIGRPSASQYVNQGRIFNGDISEILAYDDLLTINERERVNTYLAVKYGLTLSHNYYFSNSTLIKDVTDGYANNIAGIGVDSCGALIQKQSVSQLDEAIVTIGLGSVVATNQLNTNNFSADNDFLIWGNNGAAENTNWDNTNFSIPGGVLTGIDRVWKLDEIGDVGQIELIIDPDDVDFDLPNIPAAPLSDGNIYILFDNDGDFTNGGSSVFPMTSNSIIIPDAASTYFTFAVGQLTEICDDGIDNDGDGSIDEVCAFTNCDSIAYITSGRNNSSPLYLQTIDAVTHPFAFDTVGLVSNTANNAIGYRVQDNFIYGIKKANNSLVRIGSDANELNLGLIPGLPGGGYNAGDVFADGYLYIKHSGLNDDIYQIDVTATPPVIANTYQLSQNILIADFAFSDADNKVYTMGRNGLKYMIDPSTWTVTEIGSPGPVQDYGAVYTSQDGKVFVYGNQTGNIYQVDFGLNGTGTGDMFFVGNAPKVSTNDGASCRGVFVTPEICGNLFDDDSDGDIDCADSECPVPIISDINITNPTNCPTLENGSIEVIAIGFNLEYSIDDGVTFQSSNTFTNLSGGTYNIVVLNIINFCYAYTFMTITVTNPSCPEFCGDGIDNDFDGATDFEDSECEICGTTFTSEKIYISKYGSSTCGDDLLILDWEAGTMTATNEQNLGQDVIGQGWSDIAFTPDGNMYANWTPDDDNMELYTIDPSTGESINFICLLDGVSPYITQSELVSDIDGYLYTVLGDGTTTALYKYKPTDINLDDICDSLTLVVNLTATGLVGNGDLAWSNGILYWTATVSNVISSPSQLVEIDIDAGTYIIHPLLDNLGNPLTEVNAVLNDSEGSLIVGDENNNLYEVDKTDFSLSLIYTLTNNCDAIGGMASRYEFIESVACAEICDDGIDNDADGNIDCDDSDCIPEVNIASLNTCDNSNMTGTGIFILNDANNAVTFETGVTISYHTTLANAQNNISPLISPYTSSDATVYARVENSIGCYATALVTLNVGAKCAEHCGNGNDDDGDGLIDCDDPDCICCKAN